MEQADDIQESAGNIFCNKDGGVLVLRISLSFQVPVLDGSNDMAFISAAQLHLDLVALNSIRILKKQVKPTSPCLSSLLVLEDEFSESQQRWIFRKSILDPTLIQFWVTLQGDD